MTSWTVEMLAAQPRWDPARLAAVPGRCRGDLLGPWGDNLTKRFGAAALPRVRARLVPPLDQMRAVQTSTDWVPEYAQVAVTEAIVDEFLGGDLAALGPLFVEDARTNVSRMHRLLARSIGASRAIRIVPKPFRKLYERGSAEATVDGRRGRLSFSGSVLFANPTWRVLQLFSVRALLELTGSTGTAVGDDTGADSFAAIVSW
ncbi:MAG: hypothetical protein H0T42_03055 [Deltaproteobacteria bacterium]|nr:hypothetical protein [Deltaproteobacteria bacterium]